MKRASTLPGIALIVAAALFPAAADAQLYLATAGDHVGSLYTVNPATGVATLVGPTTIGGNNVAITGLAFQPGTNVLFGVSADISSASPRSLVTINAANGNATLIGSLGARAVVDISFRGNGVLYGWQKNSGGGLRGSLARNPLAVSDDLVTINLSTGAVTAIGNPGIGGTQGGGLAFVLGTLYLSVATSSGALRTVDPATGLTTVGPTMSGSGGKISAMSASPTGVLYAVAGASSLVTINTTTGAVLTVGGGGTLPTGSDALAFLGSGIGPGGATVTDIPALGLFGLLVLGVMLAAASLLVSRIR